jgi:hypothetical protein
MVILVCNNDLIRQRNNPSDKYVYSVLIETPQMKGQTVRHTAQKRWEINIMKGTSIFFPSRNLPCFPFPCCNSRSLHGGWKVAGMKVR